MDLAELGIVVRSDGVLVAEGRLDGMTKAGGRAEKSVGRLGDAAKRAMTPMRNMAKAAVGLVAAFAGAAGLNQAVQEARTFSGALAETSTLIKGTASEMAFLETQAKRMAGEFGGSATQQVQAFYQAISAGAGSVKEATTLLESANKFALGGVTDVTTGVDALTTAVNAYAASGLTASQASDALFVGIKGGKTTAAELAASLGQIVPIASSAGVSFDELVAGVAALTTQGQSTAMATTGLRQTIASIINPTQQARKQAKALGIDFSASALEAKGLGGVLQEVAQKTGGSKEALGRLFGSVEALNAVLAFSGGAGASFTGMMADMTQKSGATQEAVDKLAQGLDQRLNKAVGQIGNLALSAGQALLTLLVPALEAVATIATTVSHNIDILAVGIGTLSAVYFAPAIASLATFVVGLNSLQISLIAAAAASKAMALATGLATTALSVMGGPLGIVFAILGASGAAWLIWNKGARDSEASSYDAAAATSALLGELDAFYETVAPNAAAKAIDLANANHKLAASAYSAAKAELAKRKAMLDMAASSGVGGTTGSIRDMGSSASFEKPKYEAALDKLTQAETALNQAMRDRKVAAQTVTGSMSEVMTQNLKNADATRKYTFELLGGTGAGVSGASGSGGGLTGAAKKAAGAQSKLRDELTKTQEKMGSWIDQLSDALLQGGKGIKSFVVSAMREFAKFQLSQGLRALAGLPMQKSGGGILGALFGGIFGKRANGGPVRAGHPYLVNENTPKSEVFVPSQPGHVLNRRQAQDALGGGQQQVHVTVGIDADSNGNLTPFVSNIARQTTQSGLSNYHREVVQPRFSGVRG